MKSQTMAPIQVVLLQLFILATSSSLFGQDFQWAKSIGSPQDDFASSITTDRLGNVYTTGRFKSTADFDPGQGIFNLSATGGIDIFISKLDLNGNFVWAKAIGGSNLDEGLDIKVDDSGNVFVTGYFRGTVDFDPGPGTFNLTSAASASLGPDLFVLKLDSSGDFVWVKKIGSFAWDVGNALQLDPGGNILLTGYFTGTVDFDPGPGVFNLVAGADNDVFILQLDSIGDFVWAKSIGGNDEDDGALAIGLDHESNIYLTGSFAGTLDFDPGTNITNLTSTGVRDIFICKLTQDGNFIWAKKVGGAGNDYGTQLAFDSSNNVYITGNFRGGNVDFDPGPNTFTLGSQGQNDVFILKLDSAGAFIWAKQMGGPSFDSGNSIQIDSNDNIYTFGHFQDSVDFDPGIETVRVTAAGIDDIFIQKLDHNGNFIWIKTIGGISNDKCRAAAIDSGGSLYLTGEFKDTVDFDPESGVSNLTANNGADIFILKLSCISYDSIDITACDSYTSPSGNYTWSSSNTYTDTLSNAANCDSIITINLTIDTVNITVTETGSVLNAIQAGVNYQWIDCATMLPIIVATNQTFTATTNGSYAVIINNNNCIDTSLCYSVVTVGVADNNVIPALKAYPNPTKNSLSIDLGQKYKNTSVTITDIVGRTVHSTVHKDRQYLHIAFGDPPGVYFLLVEADSKKSVVRFVKE